MTDLERLRQLLLSGPCERAALAEAFGGDREARLLIEEARRTTDWGALILPDPYRLATSDDELAQFLGSERRRGLSILVRVRQQRRRGLDALRALPLRQGHLL
jgi:hypothetical protein